MDVTGGIQVRKRRHAHFNMRITFILPIAGDNSLIGRSEIDTLVKYLGQTLNRSQLPVAGERFLVRYLSKKGGTVFDLFGGSGTSSIAALVEGRHAVYIDKDPDQYRLFETRATDYFRMEEMKAAALGLGTEGMPEEEVKKLAEAFNTATVPSAEQLEFGSMVGSIVEPANFNGAMCALMGRARALKIELNLDDIRLQQVQPYDYEAAEEFVGYILSTGMEFDHWRHVFLDMKQFATQRDTVASFTNKDNGERVKRDYLTWLEVDVRFCYLSFMVALHVDS